MKEQRDKGVRGGGVVVEHMMDVCILNDKAFSLFIAVK